MCAALVSKLIELDKRSLEVSMAAIIVTKVYCMCVALQKVQTLAYYKCRQ